MDIDISILIPCFNEERLIKATLDGIVAVLSKEEIKYEIICVNNASSDQTEAIISEYSIKNPLIKCVNSENRLGYGIAIKTGLMAHQGNAVIFVMADSSEDPRDILLLYRRLEQGYDCVCGDRFNNSENLVDYPKLKLLLNRVGNKAISRYLGLNFNDLTYGFKCYKSDTLDRVGQLSSNGFDINLELFLRAYFKGASVSSVDVSWRERSSGVSKFKLFKECWLNGTTFIRVLWTTKKSFSKKSHGKVTG